MILPQVQLTCLQTLAPTSLALCLYSQPLAGVPLATLADQAWHHFDHQQLEAALVLFALIQGRSHLEADDYFQSVAHNSLLFLATALEPPAAVATLAPSRLLPTPQDPLLRLEAEVHLAEGRFCYQQGEWHDALRHLDLALQTFSALQVGVGVGCTLALMAQIHWLQGEPSRALAYSQAAVAVLEDTPARPERAQALTCMGLVHLQQRDYPQAQQALEAALHLYQALQDPFQEGVVLTCLGRVYAQRREFMFALACYEATLDLYWPLPRTDYVERQTARVLTWLGQLCEETKRPELAIAPYQDALDRYQRLGDTRRGQPLARRLGSLYEDQGRFTLALDYYQQALQAMAPEAIGSTPLRGDDPIAYADLFLQGDLQSYGKPV